MDMLVTTQWLVEQIEPTGGQAGDDLVILDASLHLPAAQRDAAAEYSAGHIPGARFLDLATLVDPDGGDPRGGADNALPGAELFAGRMRALGISNGSRIVLYDDSPPGSTARGWFLCTIFGAGDVAILNGGLAKWKSEGRPLSQGRDESVASGNFTAGSTARFTGAEGEPRPGMAAGHIPGAANLPIGMLHRPDGTMKDNDAIAAEFTAAGIDLDRPVVTMCGSGVAASLLGFTLARLGKRDTALYDGSWAEWEADPATPEATGLPHAERREAGNA